MKNISRRSFIVSGIVGVSSVTGTLPIFLSSSFAGDKHSMAMKPLADALKAANHPVCESVAAKVLSFNESQSSYDLHLRSADLDNK